ncbi:hypothetical protein ACCO45_005025 [Purpureocillium lilacinum]|uniref:Uncharacterized protein n=1 Tax=Purpureocillium lilacinum TaxID=33203 RepID=A0ACC4DUX0_PURLI
MLHLSKRAWIHGEGTPAPLPALAPPGALPGITGEGRAKPSRGPRGSLGTSRRVPGYLPPGIAIRRGGAVRTAETLSEQEAAAQSGAAAAPIPVSHLLRRAPTSHTTRDHFTPSPAKPTQASLGEPCRYVPELTGRLDRGAGRFGHWTSTKRMGGEGEEEDEGWWCGHRGSIGEEKENNETDFGQAPPSPAQCAAGLAGG